MKTGMLLLLLASPSFAAPVASSSAYLATITSMTKMVRVQLKDGTTPEAATVGQKLPQGAVVLTLDNAFCEVRFSQAHFVRLGPSSKLKIARMEKKKGARVLLQLLAGRVRSMIDRSLGEEADFGVYGATTITAVKGTNFDMTRNTLDEVAVLVNEGRVMVAELKSEDPSEIDKIFAAVLIGKLGIDLREGKMINVTPGSLFPSPVPIPAGFPDPFAGPMAPAGKPQGPKAPGLPGLPGFGMP